MTHHNSLGVAVIACGGSLLPCGRRARRGRLSCQVGGRYSHNLSSRLSDGMIR